MTTLSHFDALLAEVQRLKEEHVLLQEENERLKNAVAASTDPDSPAAPAPVAAPEPSYPVGSKYVWTNISSNDIKRRVVAIQLKDGVIQVKDITSGNDNYDDNKCDFTKKFYKSFDEWRSTLPEGEVKSEASDGLTYLEHRLKMPFPKSPQAKDDCDALRIFCGRWSVMDKAFESYSPADTLEYYRKAFKEKQHEVAYIPTGNYDAEKAKQTIDRMNILRSYYKRIQYYQEHNKSLTEEELHKKPVHIKWGHYKAKLYALVKGQPHLIMPSEKLYNDNNPGFMWCNRRKGTTFAELGIDLKPDGTPYLELAYRTKYYKF